MLFVVVVIFGGFWLWRAVGRKLAVKNRAQSGAMHQIAALGAFLFGVVLGSRLGNALPPLMPDSPAASVLIADTALPVGCGLVCGLVVWAVVALLPVAPSRMYQPAAHNPFDDEPTSP